MSDIASHLFSLEQRLADADPGDPGLADLLAEDMLEFGASGRTWTRADTVAGVLAGKRREVVLSEFAVDMLAADVALVTFRSAAGGRTALRSSVWVARNGHWQLRFHQGTLTRSGGGRATTDPTVADERPA